MSAGEDESVPAEPRRVVRVVAKEALKEQVGGGCEAHRGAGVPVARALDRIHSESPNGGNGTAVHVIPREGAFSDERTGLGHGLGIGHPGSLATGPAVARGIVRLQEEVPDSLARGPLAAAQRGDAMAQVEQRPGGSDLSGWQTIRHYVAITKPRIIELLLVTAIPSMILAAQGWPDPVTAIAVIVGGMLAAGGANAYNSVYDRDIDALMARTHARPVATGAVSVRGGLVLATMLSIASVVVLATFANLLSAALAIVAIAFYAVGYTMLLKRRTSQNIVWGGAAGCMPVLIAWSAITGSLSWTPVVLFLIVFWWTPPHYWPLSLRYRDDYAAAGVPMLPVVSDIRSVTRSIVIYSWVMVATSLILIPVAPMGWVYSLSAVVLGAVFLTEAHLLRRRALAGAEDVRPMRLFHWSITYLALLFLAVAIDPFVTV